MDISRAIIMDVLQKVDGSRKCSGIYYILTGKKTAQSLSDSQWFKIEPYYASLKGLTVEDFNSILDELCTKEFINLKEDQVFLISEKGSNFLEKNKSYYFFMEKLNGLKYASIEHKCWQVLSLFVQSLSNALYHFLNFSPVIRDRDAAEKVKILFPRTDEQRKQVASQLYIELKIILKKCDSKSAEIFVNKLSGYNRVGHTFDQSAREWGLSRVEAVLRFRSVLHMIFYSIKEKPESYTVLYTLLGELIDIPALTKSALQTYHLLKQEKDLKEIMKIRNLKLSTMEDHLVEIAREIPDFSIQPYIRDEDKDRVSHFYNKTKKFKLRPIKEAFPHLTYLQIRLVLAKEGGKHAVGSGT
ncbi:helix-turn-helix domain-containing protein [Fictibacillus phosphorivorans]|uniref:helix-turn-helix domain-containing protein n=1 Tax=Fictibacillus phosphorivorans TaxID=1221500 RepID=UPI00203DCB1F|nr:helix-turn-helix domain-containing protein [Fictibacillus phosphorivorans]MCM3720314.1 helix-turn-helix domain-containing protein [Fictibacillus phosphorivorans]MCM3778004.1 helix-turn-helix domain-containing protein [Fictibacillus phosphorivorans]